MHPGEVHACRDPLDRATDTHFRVAYVPPHWLAEAAGEIDGRVHRELVVQPVIEQPDLAMSFLRWHRLHDTNHASLLTRESAALAVLVRLVGRHCDAGVLEVTPPAARSAVAAARSHLHDAGPHNLSLTELAARVHLTRYHLVRAFHAEVGLPPHAYHTQLRVHRARRLLLSGHSVADAAVQTGFVDHSHLSRHFTRLVGVPPGRYARRREPRR
jgi:AraC-like DNA-binding protein